jgi:folate-dependent phosphoribosylglycinamide formyltransferase PurN
MTHQLIQARPGEVVGIVRSDCLVYRKTLPGGLWYLVRQTGLRFVGRKGLDMVQSRAMAIFFRLIRRPLKVPSLREVKARYDIPVVGSKDVNDLGSITTIRDWQPDLVISIYLNQLIKRELIDLPRLGCLNIHPALLPRNRGLFPYFWAMANGDGQTGVTLHWVDERFDTGDLLLQEALPIEPNESMTSLQYKSAQVGAEMLIRGVELVEGGNAPHIPQDNSQATYFSWPRPADLRRFRRRGGDYGTVFELMRYM